jgi:acyl-CoA synthetase (AMP-forming)/AMP-acid ligase II
MPPQPDLLSLTLPALLRLRAAQTPEGLALSVRTLAGGRDRLRYAALVDAMDRMAAGLHAAGLRPGQRLAVFLDNWAGREAVLSALGALRLGAAVSPINTRYGDAALRHALALIAPQIVICPEPEAARLARLCPGAHLLIPGAAGAARWPDPVESERPAPPLPDPQDPDCMGPLLFTSGTTALPKAVVHSHRSMIAAGLACGTALGLRPGDLYHGGWPFSTSSGLNLGCASAWATGGGLVLEEPLDNAGRLALIAAERSTFYHGVPSVVHFLVEETARGGYDLSSLRRVGYGGSAMPRRVVERLDALWPHVEQVQIYGMTESGPSGTVLAPRDRHRRFGSVGRAMPHCAVRVVDAEGRDRAPGEDGEIVLCGPAVAQGYLDNPEASARAFDCGGIRTGDVGHLDEEGYLYFTDRLKDIINRGGMKIASIAVEEALYAHPAIREAAVVAVAHDALGEDIGACLVAEPGASLDLQEIAGFCRERLADYEVPRHWQVLPALPRNAMGKVLKAELRAGFPAAAAAAGTAGAALSRG